jgi:hypothetical protein
VQKFINVGVDAKKRSVITFTYEQTFEKARVEANRRIAINFTDE